MPANKAMKILVVDDQETMRVSIKSILRALEFKNIDYAENGEEAYQMLTKGEFDFLITDWMMPKMTGMELLKKIRSDAKLSKLPVLMLTAEGKQDNIMEAIKAKVSNYVVKPFDAKTLDNKINQIFR
ncbi:MAG: response regulator [SAR324 cluster bacterium]|nr:response regulator [SAR324 cluster bacterium]